MDLVEKVRAAGSSGAGVGHVVGLWPQKPGALQSAEQLSALLYSIQHDIKLDVTVNIYAVTWLTTVVTAGTSYIRADQSADIQVGLLAALGHLNSFRNTI